MSNAEFIKKLGNAAVKHYKTYKILPSLTIAQAILESGWGKSDLAKKCHNYFGMKWVEGCGCGYKAYKTLEQKSDGTYYTITAKFRKYSTLSKGIKGYYEFLQYPRYAKLKGVTDYRRACALIKECGWATSLSYTQTLITLIEQYGLTAYDKKALDTETQKSSSAKTSTTKTQKWTPKIGEKVIVSGKIYGNGDGSGGCLKKGKETMYIVDMVDKNHYKYYIGVSAKKNGIRQGWGNTNNIKKA